MAGIRRLAAWVLPNMPDYQAMRFNQFHNASDLDDRQAVMYVERTPTVGWDILPLDADPERLWVDRFAKEYALQYVCSMVNQYGQFSGAVVGGTGNLLAGHTYARACQIMRQPLHCYRLPLTITDEQARAFLSQEYGEFSYDSVPRQTWNQTYAQIIRRGDNSSNLYLKYVIPLVEKSDTILDFGAGRFINVRALRRQGYAIEGWEPYPRSATHLIDVGFYRDNQARLAAMLRSRGLFDYVVCDSVLNSVDSKQAERDVCLSLRAFCKPGGRVCVAGRHRGNMEAILSGKRKVLTHTRQKTAFLDADGFTAQPGKGSGWTFQLFHDDQTAKAACRLIAGPDGGLVAYQQDGYMWRAIVARDTTPAGTEEMEAVKRELTLPLPGEWGYLPDSEPLWLALQAALSA